MVSPAVRVRKEKNVAARKRSKRKAALKQARAIYASGYGKKRGRKKKR